MIWFNSMICELFGHTWADKDSIMVRRTNTWHPDKVMVTLYCARCGHNENYEKRIN